MGDDVRRLLVHVGGLRHPYRNCVIVLLSFHAGMRACEIAGLDWRMVLTSTGEIADTIVLSCGITKGGRSRCIPVSPQLQRALRRLHRSQDRPLAGPVILSERDRAMTPRSIVNWFSRAYTAVGLMGCSSHSGRRTFITRAARVLAKSGGSLRDIQELAGHSAITTTERYIAGDRDAQRRLVRMI